MKILKKLFKQPTRFYISEAEKFMEDFDKRHPQKSGSQLKEIEKHQRIAYLRDQAVTESDENKQWKGF